MLYSPPRRGGEPPRQARAAGGQFGDVLCRAVAHSRNIEKLRISGFARCRAELLAIHRDIAGIRDVRSILRSGPFHSDDHTDFHCDACPALTSETIWTAHLTTPVRDLAGLWILHIDVEVNVRIHPLDFRHNTGEIDSLTRVELGRKRMMGQSGSNRCN